MDATAALSNMQVDVLKEPRGFMKILQFLFTICAFATTTSFSSVLKMSFPCGGSTSVAEIPIEYNFKLSQLQIAACNGTSLFFRQDFSSDSGFFVAVGVLAFLFTIAMLIIYCFLSVLYEANPMYPLADCAFHAIFAVLYLACSSAWANSLNGLKAATNSVTLNDENENLCHGQCKVESAANFAKLNISIIFGFLNCFLFASNIWFLYKETAIFKEKQAETQAAPPPQA